MKFESVSVIVISPQGRVLLGKRLAKSFIGSYQTPGGMVDPDEPIVAAAVREAREELGAEVQVFFECPQTMEYTGTFEAGTSNNTITVHYVFATLEGPIKVPESEREKCNDWAFYERDKLPSPLTFVTAYGLHVLDFYCGDVHAVATLIEKFRR
jgi:8-oxo-dGTP pyrophosphatase MutT (NUDIX family)